MKTADFQVTHAYASELDSELMLRVKNGDEMCLEMLLQKHRGPVIHFLYRMIQNRAVAEELAQNVFLRVYGSRATYEPTAKFTTWLYRIASHLALNWIRDTRHERFHTSIDEHFDRGAPRQLPDSRPTVDQTLLRNVRDREVRHAIAALPPRQRAVVILHKYEELEYSKIAHALNTSEQAVKSLLFRAYRTLRVHLAHLRCEAA